MNPIDNIYKPNDFSATRCYVIRLSVNINGYMKIEQKLPVYVQKLKGVFISVSCLNSPMKAAGFIALNFNGYGLKNIQTPVIRTNLLLNCSRQVSFNEQIKPNSLLQGYYFDGTKGAGGYPYTLSIYLHYEVL